MGLLTEQGNISQRLKRKEDRYITTQKAQLPKRSEKRKKLLIENNR